MGFPFLFWGGDLVNVYGEILMILISDKVSFFSPNVFKSIINSNFIELVLYLFPYLLIIIV